MLSADEEWTKDAARRGARPASRRRWRRRRNPGLQRASRRASARKAWMRLHGPEPRAVEGRSTSPPSEAWFDRVRHLSGGDHRGASSSAASSSTTASISPGVTSGRAASWTTTISLSVSSRALATDSSDAPHRRRPRLPDRPPARAARVEMRRRSRRSRLRRETPPATTRASGAPPAR